MFATLAIAPVSFAPGLVSTARPAAPMTSGIAMQAEAAPEPAPIFSSVEFTKELPGVSAPLGFFDPLGFCGGDATEGRVRFLREVELKHARVAMLASVGFVVAEVFHPLFGGEIDVPSYIAFQQTPLQTFWQWTLAVIGVLEVASIQTFNFPIRQGWKDGEMYTVYPVWEIKKKHGPGDFGFDPAGFKPSTPAELKAMQTKELNNGRLAMIAMAGMVGQELASGAKLF